METGTMLAAGAGEDGALGVLMSDESLQLEFRTLLARAQQGSPEASHELYEKYVSHVLRCVRHRMWRRLRSKFDSQDFVQSVWKSFFDDAASLPNFQSPEELIDYLQAMARTKVIEEGRRRLATKRDDRLELPIDDRSEPVGPHPATRLPTPSTVAIFRERYQSVVEQQPAKEREIADLRLEGNTFPEIGEKLDMHPSNARKLMRQLKRRTTRPGKKKF